METKRLEETVQAIQEKIGAFMEARMSRDWHFDLDGLSDPMAEPLESSRWKLINSGHSWSSEAGYGWLRKEATLPAEINGIATAGSPVSLVFCLPIGSSVYLDGQMIFDEPFWSDTRGIFLPLVDRYEAGRKLSLTIKAKTGDGFGYFVEGWLCIEQCEQMVFALETVREQLRFGRHLVDKLRKEDSPRTDLENALEQAVARMDLDALRANQWEAWDASVKKALSGLGDLSAMAKEFEVKCLAHAHIDMNWLWTQAETERVCERDFATADALMERYPEFHFSQSQTATYRFMEEKNPELFDRIRQRIQKGQWDLTASTWVEGDLNTAQGETLARHLLYARRYSQQHFGVRSSVLWEPDTFGHPITMPQILAAAGVKYYYLCRGIYDSPIYWWESPDGSRVLVCADATGYGGRISPGEIVTGAIRYDEPLGLKTGLQVYGMGDHGGGATAQDIENGRTLNKSAPLLPRIKLAGAPEFFEAAEESGIEFPIVRREQNPLFEGCYTSHADIKRLNRHGENLLLTAESMTALATALTGAPASARERLAEAWKAQCFHQFHDIFCGCAIHSTYQDAAKVLEPVQAGVRAATAQAAAALAARVDTGADGKMKVVVFNPLAWTRTDLARAPLAELGLEGKDLSKYVARDTAGKSTAVQMLDGELAFVAADVPALGCGVYAIEETSESELGMLRRVKADVASLTLENDELLLRVNPASGELNSLVLKQTNRELAPLKSMGGMGQPTYGNTLNRFTVYHEAPHAMSAWIIGETTRTENLLSGAEVKLVENGPVCAAVEVKHKFLNSSLCQQIRVYAGLSRIDFITEVDWHEKGTASQDAPMLRVSFTPSFVAGQPVYEIPFGAQERPANGFEVPALRWADLAGEGCGLTLLNESKYGHNATGNTLSLTLVRASYEPDVNPDEGLHRFTYSVVPHAGDWKQAGSARRGAELNQSLLTVAQPAHSGELKPGVAAVDCAAENVIVTSIKLAEDQPEKGQAIIIRLLESWGVAGKARLICKMPVARAAEVNLIEEEEQTVAVKDGVVEIEMGKHQIRTIKLYTK